MECWKMKFFFIFFFCHFNCYTFLILFFFFFSIERVLETSYHGLIKENETLVEITPEIKIDESKKICGFEIEKNLKKKIPFEVSFC